MSLNIQFKKLEQDYPYDLLLLADESRSAIDQYIHKCEVFSIDLAEETIGILAIETINQENIEIKNIAIKPDYQKRGIGQKVIQWTKEYYKQKGIQAISVGTGDASVFQLLFYLKCGFRFESIRKSFFLENYEDAIYENGVQLKDMIVLKMNLEQI